MYSQQVVKFVHLIHSIDINIMFQQCINKVELPWRSKGMQR